ncbi:hypothetical protein HPB50_021690 [Hyalomma asiaticum]|uniref:Uncharacterized protein n=1 Tax=Hyalomma asiaticum TaxID=266040 RepID=A0ACB7TBE6_HYAAI|nr:hypothetical protein HPB50_021690 [Hyalomma asiaticum]
MSGETEKPAEPTGKGRSGALIVSSRQKGNPLLKSIRSVPWEFGDIEPDYVLGQTTCALYLSLRYHQLFPGYIHSRLRSLGRAFELRLLLVQVDVADPHPSLRELSQVSLLADCTMLLAWSAEEAGRHLETYKALEAKPADALMERQEGDTLSKLTDALSSVRSLNRPDAVALLSSFGSLERLAAASEQELILQPGLGPHKVQFTLSQSCTTKALVLCTEVCAKIMMLGEVFPLLQRSIASKGGRQND